MRHFVQKAMSIGAWGGMLLTAGLAAGVLTGPPARGQVPLDPVLSPATMPAGGGLASGPTSNPIGSTGGSAGPVDQAPGVLMPQLPGVAGVAPGIVNAAATRPIKDDLLGKLFTSVSAGIAFKPPADCKQVQPKAENQIVEFDSDVTDLHQGWVLTVSKLAAFVHDQVLTTSNGHAGIPYVVTDPPVPPHLTPTTRSVTDPGVMEQYLVQLKRSYGVLEVRRQDTIYAGQSGLLNIGLLAVQYTLGGQHVLKQVAIVEHDSKQFFVLDLTTPGSDNPDSPLLRDAADAFSQMMDSIQLLDQSTLRHDQDLRIFDTAALFAFWTPKIVNQVLVPQRYLRLVRGDKDVGYVYATEKAFQESGLPAVRIALRMHRNDGTSVTDSQTIMASTLDFDHSHEQWSTLLTVPNPKNPAPDEYSEIGASDYTANIPVPVPAGPGVAPGAIKMTSKHDLTVTGSLPNTGPEHRNIALPQWYLPQALQYLLPRIVVNALSGNHNKFLFYCWVPSTHEVMLLYCDVLPAENIRFNGQNVTAYQIKTHITLDGPVTTDFVDLQGNYLGAQSDRVDDNNKTTQELVIPSDADALKKIWGHPNLTEPGGDERTTN